MAPDEACLAPRVFYLEFSAGGAISLGLDYTFSILTQFLKTFFLSFFRLVKNKNLKLDREFFVSNLVSGELNCV